jgi:hypothetical protein
MVGALPSGGGDQHLLNITMALDYRNLLIPHTQLAYMTPSRLRRK